MTTTKSPTISFRLPPTPARQLAREAAARGLSPGAFARRVLLDALAGDDRVLDELAAVRQDVGCVRADLRRVAVAVLADAGKATLAEAEGWARDNLGG
jgi:hypothetical protein